MADVELEDSVKSMQAKETEHAVPIGIWALFGGLVVWGVYYFFTWVGWDQAADVKGGGAALGTNIGSTVAYTAIPAAVVIALAVAMSRRRRSK
jgi:heme/copper-type cytochrome/quinol oxidase subunit 2